MSLRCSGTALGLALLVSMGCGGDGDSLTLSRDTVDVTAGNGPQNRVMVTHVGGTHLSVDCAPGQPENSCGTCIGWAWQDLDSQGPWYVEPFKQYPCTSTVILRVSLLGADREVLAHRDLTVIASY